MNEVYPMIPAASKALWFLGTIGLLLIAVGGALGVVAFSARNTRVEITSEGLHVRGDPFFGREIPWTHLRTTEAAVVPIGHSAPHRPVRRTWGTGLPGYRAGWFRLASGESALAFLTAGSRAVYVPTTDDWALLLTVEDPDALVTRLRSQAGSS